MDKDASYTFKHKKDRLLFSYTRLELQIIFLDLCQFCEINELPRPTITSTIRGRLTRSISDTHSEGRAIDIRSWVYNRKEIDVLCNYVNKKYAKQYGTGPKGKLAKCLIYEEIGKNSHMHLQIKR